jgi:GNAT superfamily N-acetyltransferase
MAAFYSGIIHDNLSARHYAGSKIPSGTSMQDPIIDIIHENPTQADQRSILDALLAFNVTRSGMSDDEPDFAVLVRDPWAKEVIGGLYAVDGYGWAFVKYLVVPEEYRGKGVGSRLLTAAEEIARSRGYIGMWLDTFEFQARPFYEKMGYEIFGELEGGPGAMQRYFLKKRF